MIIRLNLYEISRKIKLNASRLNQNTMIPVSLFLVGGFFVSALLVPHLVSAQELEGLFRPERARFFQIEKQEPSVAIVSPANHTTVDRASPLPVVVRYESGSMAVMRNGEQMMEMTTNPITAVEIFLNGESVGVASPLPDRSGEAIFTVDLNTLPSSLAEATLQAKGYRWYLPESPLLMRSSRIGAPRPAAESEIITIHINDAQPAIGTLTLETDPSSPASGLIVGSSSGITVGVMIAQARYEDIRINSLSLKMAAINGGGPDQVDKIWLTDGVKTVGVIPTSTDANAPVQIIFDLSSDPFEIPAETTNLLTIKVDTSVVYGELPSKGAMSEGFKFSINSFADVVTQGVSSGALADVVGTPQFGEFTLYKSVPTVDVVSNPVTNLMRSNGTYELFKFNITADPKGDIGIYKLTYGIATTTVKVTNFGVYDSSYLSYMPVATLAAERDPQGSSAQNIIEFLIDTDSSGTANGGEFRAIAAGSTRTFTLKGTVSGYTPDGLNIINTSLLGDAAFPLPVVRCAGTTFGNNACIGIDSNDQDDFIWSDLNYGNNSTTATNTSEWTNGFRVPGLNPTTSTSQAI